MPDIPVTSRFKLLCVCVADSSVPGLPDRSRLFILLRWPCRASRNVVMIWRYLSRVCVDNFRSVGPLFWICFSWLVKAPMSGALVLEPLVPDPLPLVPDPLPLVPDPLPLVPAPLPLVPDPLVLDPLVFDISSAIL